MSYILLSVGVVCLTMFCTDPVAGAGMNFLIKHFEVCPTNGTAKFSANITREANRHYLNFDLNSPLPLDKNIGMITNIETAITDKMYTPLFEIKEKFFCEALNKYMGEFWYDIQRAARMSPGVCPVPGGRYHVHHLLLNFNKITLQTFPFGRLRFTMTAIDKRHNLITFCIMTEVENLPF